MYSQGYTTESDVPLARPAYVSAPQYSQVAYFAQSPPQVILAVRAAPPRSQTPAKDPCVVVCVAVWLIVVLTIMWTAILP
jgi:hypothetical protein